jgi:hypothetical protein
MRPRQRMLIAYASAAARPALTGRLDATPTTMMTATSASGTP